MNDKENNLTTTRLFNALRFLRVDVDIDTTDNIIDVVELIYEKGGDVTIDDLIALKKQWVSK